MRTGSVEIADIISARIVLGECLRAASDEKLLGWLMSDTFHTDLII